MENDKEKEVVELQSLINTKAEERLNADIGKLTEFISQSPVIYSQWNNKVFVAVVEKDDKGALTKIVGNPGTLETLIGKFGILRKHLYDANIESYISAETEDFMHKVESMRTDLDNLMSGRPQEEE